MQVDETIRTYDLAEALRGETGKFEVVTAQGTRMIITTTADYSIGTLQFVSEGGSEQMIWIKKIAEFHNHSLPHVRSYAAAD